VALRFGSEFPCINQPNFTTTTTTIAPCPCWYSGLTLFVEFETNFYVGLVFEPTYQFLNGYPIFYCLFSEETYNLYWTGTNWVLSNLTDPIDVLELFFETTEPIGPFIYTLFDPFTGNSVCEVYQYIAVERCPILTECVTDFFFPCYTSSTEIQYTNLTNDFLYYDGTDWVYRYNDVEIASLSGLTSNDAPIGSWEIIDVINFTSVTSQNVFDLLPKGCNCFSLIQDCTPSCIDETTFTYIDCYGVINEVSVDLSLGYTGCGLTLSGAITNTTISYISGDTFLATSCVDVCTTTTTAYPYCTPISPITTTTTSICPSVCNLTSGFYANKFEVICQKVDGSGRPDSGEWKIIDFTSQLSGLTVNGYITQQSLTANTFVITQELYDSADIYDLSDYIDLTTVGFTGHQLNFGDEYYFYGNVETDIQATIYEMVYKINLSQAEFQTPSNPSWLTTNNRYITEIGLYDSDKNLMIISKMQSPTLRQGIQQFLIKLDI
jgi:hypothetical protein